MHSWPPIALSDEHMCEYMSECVHGARLLGAREHARQHVVQVNVEVHGCRRLDRSSFALQKDEVERGVTIECARIELSARTLGTATTPMVVSCSKGLASPEPELGQLKQEAGRSMEHRERGVAIAVIEGDLPESRA